MGEVYRARDTRLDRVVAIKILPTNLSLNPRFRLSAMGWHHSWVLRLPDLDHCKLAVLNSLDSRPPQFYGGHYSVVRIANYLT